MEPASHAEQVGAAQGLNQLSLEGDRSNGQRPASPATPIDGAITLGQALLTNLGQVVLGARDALTAAAVAALSGGHLLIEDVPGVGKTVLARALATSLGAELSRVQGHPDLLPSDVTGISVFSPDTGSWDFRPGPVFAHVVLVDELNRTPPRTQSALLETMEEQQVSVDGQSWPLPRPHLVIATQNPRSPAGHLPPGGEPAGPIRHRHVHRLSRTPPTRPSWRVQQAGKFALAGLAPVCTTGGWWDAQAATESVLVAAPVAGICRRSCAGRPGRRRAFASAPAPGPPSG